MTVLTINRPWTTSTIRRPAVVRQLAAWVAFLDAAAAVLRPLLVTVAVIIAAAASPAPARADSPNDSINGLNEAGIGNNAPLSTDVAGIGQSICPMLVKPGARLASAASQMTGNTGLSPAIAGFVTSMAIQMECPGFVTSLADGDIPLPLHAPEANTAGASPALPHQFQLPTL